MPGFGETKARRADLGRLAHLLLKFRPHAIMLLDAQSKSLGGFLRLHLGLVREERRKNDWTQSRRLLTLAV